MAEAKTYRHRFQNKAKAEKYARRFERGARKRIDRREQHAVQKIFAELDGCSSVPDVPSGAGRVAAALAKGDRRVIESDASYEMVEIARERAEKGGVRALCQQSDAGRL